MVIEKTCQKNVKTISVYIKSTHVHKNIPKLHSCPVSNFCYFE